MNNKSGGKPIPGFYCVPDAGLSALHALTHWNFVPILEM